MSQEKREYEGIVEVAPNGAWQYRWRMSLLEANKESKLLYSSKEVGGFNTKDGAEKACRAAIAAHEREILAQEYKESQKLVFTIPADEVQT